MKKIFLAMILTLAMALMSAPAVMASGASASDAGAISLGYTSPGGSFTLPANGAGVTGGAGWSGGGYVLGERAGWASGDNAQLTIGRFCLTIPHTAFAVVTGDLTGKVISDGYAFAHMFAVPGSYKGGYAGAGAFSKASGNGWELALAGINHPVTGTTIDIQGLAGQGNWAGIDTGLGTYGSQAYANGGNNSTAAFGARDSDTGGLLSYSSVCGDAWTKGETRVYAKIDGNDGLWGTSEAWGFTKNSGFGNGGVTGEGGMNTGTYVKGPSGSWAGTQTSSSFSYYNPSGYGSGIAGGYGLSSITKIPGGVTANSHSFSFAIAK